MSIKSRGDKRTDGETDFIGHSARVTNLSSSKKYLDDQEMDGNYKAGAERPCNRWSGKKLVHTSWFPIAFPCLLPPPPPPHFNIDYTKPVCHTFSERSSICISRLQLSETSCLKCYYASYGVYFRKFRRTKSLYLQDEPPKRLELNAQWHKVTSQKTLPLVWPIPQKGIPFCCFLTFYGLRSFCAS
jgi:hypothetical protein